MKKIKKNKKKIKKKIKKHKSKKNKKIYKKKRKYSKNKKLYKLKIIKKSNLNFKKLRNTFLYRFVRFQSDLKFDPKILLNLSNKLEKNIQSFFNKIEKTIIEYRYLKQEEHKRQVIEKLEKEEKERKDVEKKIKIEEELKIKIRKKAIQDEIKIQKERTKDIKNFLRQEQALIRKEQAEKQKNFLKQIQLDKQIEKFRVREFKELEKLERISLKEKREDFKELQERIKKLKEKYRIIRDQKIRERVKALGIDISESDDRDTLLQKEKEYNLERQKIEFSLESFYRSAASLVFQLNKRHITRKMSILRCVDRRFETGEIFIKWDESSDEEWLILIYIKDNSPDQGIIIEDKSNLEKNITKEFKASEIFNASDYMVDSLTQLIDKIRKKDLN
ncbi:MAG: hypothetical protein CBE06_000790 [Pelagibacteraceae bacterium TMED246]|nr:MAG: hypothetical protein CBE06_000790 [Pelagibacteraceae bacterium TMED246]|tara:strand:- start:116 stop:1285 length:1170 start_codon:yes stop_codon:yes gene_type:complete